MAGCRDTFAAGSDFSCETFPLERNGIPLCLDRVKEEITSPVGKILLLHGSSYSSHEFDIDYQDSSPKGWSKDAFVDESINLIDLERISSPTLIIYGNKDPYMNTDLLNSALESLPEGSELQMIEGGSHIMMYEKPCYREFQNRIIRFLK